MRRRALLACLSSAAALAVADAPLAGAACSSAYPTTPVAAHAYCDELRPGARISVVEAGKANRDCHAGFLVVDAKGNRYLTIPGTCVWPRECLEEKLVPKPGDLPQGVPDPVRELYGQIIDAAEDLACISVESGKEGTFPRNAPVVLDGSGKRIGIVAYAVDKNGVNFGLVRLDKAVKASPAVPHYGGPTGVEAGEGAVGSVVKLLSPTSEKPLLPPYNATPGVAQTGWGSSYPTASVTSPLGQLYAVGTVVLTERGTALGTVPLNYVGPWAVTRLAAGLGKASAATKQVYKLVTAPLATT